MNRSIFAVAVTACALALGAFLAADVPDAEAARAGGARVDGGTVAATFSVSGATGGQDVTVTAEPTTGRIQVSPYYWYVRTGGRYLYVGLGSLEGGSCTVQRLVVAKITPTAVSATTYDATGPTDSPVTEQTFPLSQDWAQIATRIAIPAFDPVDCVTAASHPHADPADPGRTIWSTKKPAQLTPVGFNDALGIFPATVDCPREVAAGQPLDIATGFSTAPGSYTPGGLVPRPSGFESLEFTTDPSSDYTVASTPEPPTDVDLWTDEPWAGDLQLAIDPSELYFVRVSGTVSIDGHEAAWGCGSRIPITFPAPTDWVGSLAGKTWWVRGGGSNSGSGDYALHRAYEFLDDSWVYIDPEYSGPPSEPCTEVASTDFGCHRYYYDEAGNRLQIDDQRARPHAGSWGLPLYGARYENYPTDHAVRPVTTGERLAYSGRGRYGVALTLRRNGTYSCHHCAGTSHDWSGRYRFLGATQELVMRKPGADFRSGVQLYYAKHDGHPRLFDIDTDLRLFRVQRW